MLYMIYSFVYCKRTNLNCADEIGRHLRRSLISFDKFSFKTSSETTDYNPECKIEQSCSFGCDPVSHDLQVKQNQNMIEYALPSYGLNYFCNAPDMTCVFTVTIAWPFSL